MQVSPLSVYFYMQSKMLLSDQIKRTLSAKNRGKCRGMAAQVVRSSKPMATQMIPVKLKATTTAKTTKQALNTAKGP